jgi:nicotinamidase-related amidase
MGNYTNPDWANSALLTIDTQRDFTLPGAPAEIAGTMEAASVMRRLVAAFRQEGKPIVHLVRLYRPEGQKGCHLRRKDTQTNRSKHPSRTSNTRSR